MNILLFVVFLFPGMIALLFSGAVKEIKKENLAGNLIRYFCMDFLSLAITFVIIYAIRGNHLIAFSVSEQLDGVLSFNSIKFIVIFMLLEICSAVFLGITDYVAKEHKWLERFLSFIAR